MSAWENVPTPEEVATYTDEEWAEYMADVYDELSGWWDDMKFHDQNGYFAEYAGSEKCLALGHVPPADPADWETIPGHSTGWDAEALCDATRYGTACSYCEGECSQERPPLLWNLPGVIGATCA